MSRTNERASFRNQIEIGTGKPFFFRSMISAGSKARLTFFNRYFRVSRFTLSWGGSPSGRAHTVRAWVGAALESGRSRPAPATWQALEYSETGEIAAHRRNVRSRRITRRHLHPSEPSLRDVRPVRRPCNWPA